MPDILAAAASPAAALFATVLLMLALFLIARVARMRQTLALVFALLPTLVFLAMERGVLPAPPGFS
jgi:formate hydrogenlyase subunit 3/multisubunit Na+/H+ antiporter MnhD subunit